MGYVSPCGDVCMMGGGWEEDGSGPSCQSESGVCGAKP